MRSSVTIAHQHPVVHRLAKALVERGLSQKAAAEQIGVSERSIGYWLNTDVVPQRRFRVLIEKWLNEEQAA